MTDGRINALGIMSKMTGLPLGDVQQITEQIAEQAKANIKTLDACNDHDFQPIDKTKFCSRHKCARCGGDVDSLHARWYQCGREHERAKGGT